mmetsp:Transcript_23622/g.20541  ORF Transcript_23622/g.20541 Transcript_23622/m.20541 type:complete len:200 (-) Transcript_23622:235-834(-)
MSTILIVPAIGLILLSSVNNTFFNSQKIILGEFGGFNFGVAFTVITLEFGIGADGEEGLIMNFISRKSSDDDSGSLQMDSFMLNTHQNWPEFRFPVNGDLKGPFLNLFVDHFADLLSVLLDFIYIRPFIMALIEIIPIHLVNTDSAHSFELGVDSLFELAGQCEFVDEESGCVTKVEDEGMSEGFGLGVKGLLVVDHLK